MIIAVVSVVVFIENIMSELYKKIIFKLHMHAIFFISTIILGSFITNKFDFQI